MAADPIRFAKDVLLVYDWLGRVPTAEDLPPSAMELWTWAANPLHKKEFFAMAKSASDQIMKANKDSVPDEMIKKERRSIADLKNRLAAALGEAENVGTN